MQLQMFLINLTPSHTISFKYHSIIYNCFVLIRKDAHRQIFNRMLLFHTLFIYFKIICILCVLSRYWRKYFVRLYFCNMPPSGVKADMRVEIYSLPSPTWSLASLTGWNKYVTGDSPSMGLSQQLFYTPE